jgi:hypothetical protein
MSTPPPPPDTQKAAINEIHAEVTYGNGLTTEETRGMTLRELLLEVRADVAAIKVEQASVAAALAAHKSRVDSMVTLPQLVGGLGAYTTLLFSLHFFGVL